MEKTQGRVSKRVDFVRTDGPKPFSVITHYKDGPRIRVRFKHLNNARRFWLDKLDRIT